ncbi:hypothetical protein EN812_31680 [Mesorhizobium sp. M4B.F.Ca.ET.169.01.1.1]|uniref:hypothetical protein n=1 Tax=unclassified Mesorhizobium TaxID=325217 RepID=UPI000FD23176|nr:MULTISPECIES: hypothetical protein [unclassified Mesorhizobium]RUW18381.1 hypothetical protein EOA34_32110 [Mesorhizobium sp. M4B.F.Ca.ET.013.02.1.1]TGQ27416.1 hypothetical protein EN857_33125 [Mesorhizobium sp. M4B.F.Ca.ET.214.01.1.1]TGQ54577.1 hypothetical protein EN854_32985 [Mesorhizobium sp. M4B.F.Ca.ET.211.01.1.1]TGQ98973.1 hypothetical protein EN843_33850 [Mesorhizobium sp. M4B.F.Ca.ET.200.01.1.1]TGS11360.1 hypothetical protein EN833_33855 [Mesorhizobium sp. M4B.F.Ca.ET.190.01.1.1]
MELGNAAALQNPIQQALVDILFAGKLTDQKRGVGRPSVFRNSVYDDRSYEGTPKDLAVERRHCSPVHDANPSDFNAPQNGA